MHKTYPQQSCHPPIESCLFLMFLGVELILINNLIHSSFYHGLTSKITYNEGYILSVYYSKDCETSRTRLCYIRIWIPNELFYRLNNLNLEPCAISLSGLGVERPIEDPRVNKQKRGCYINPSTISIKEHACMFKFRVNTRNFICFIFPTEAAPEP